MHLELKNARADRLIDTDPLPPGGGFIAMTIDFATRYIAGK